MSTDIPTSVKNGELVKKRREQIVRAAIKCFSRKGFHKTTLPDLAAEAGISHGSIYKYISTKEEILVLIHDHLIQLAFEGLERNVKDIRDPVEKLRRIIRSRFDIMHELPDAFLLMYQEANALTGDLRKSALKDERRYLSIIEKTLEECIQQKRFKEVNPRVATHFLSLLTDCWELKRWDLRDHVNRMEFEQMAVDYIFHGISREKAELSNDAPQSRTFSGKSVMVINPWGKIGEAVVSGFLAQDAGVVVYESQTPGKKGRRTAKNPEGQPFIFSETKDGSLTDELMSHIIDQIGPIDCAVYCPESGRSGPEAVEKSIKDSARVLQAIQKLSPVLHRRMCERQSGNIIYIAPNRWQKLTNPTGYEVIKGGIEAFTRELASRCAPFKVNVNCLVPGFIGSPEEAGIRNKARKNTLQNIPAKGWGEESDISDAVLFLSSDASRFITGQVIMIDGGCKAPMY